MNDVLDDIKQAKQYLSINEVQVIDDKITANFCYHELPNPMDSYGEWISYKKVFDTWKEFSDYADKFFTELNSSSEGSGESE